MKILSVDKDTAQVELTKEEITGITFSLAWGANENMNLMEVHEQFDKLEKDLE